VYIIVYYDMQQRLCHLSTHEVYYLLNFIGYYTLTGPHHI